MPTLSKSKYIEKLKSLAILRAAITISIYVKILKVIFNQKFNYKAHIAYISQKKVIIALTLKKLTNLCLEIAQWLFYEKIVLIVDYVSLMWLLNLSASFINKFNISPKIENYIGKIKTTFLGLVISLYFAGAPGVLNNS